VPSDEGKTRDADEDKDKCREKNPIVEVTYGKMTQKKQCPNSDHDGTRNHKKSQDSNNDWSHEI
jgi:hypothetical protein